MLPLEPCRAAAILPAINSLFSARSATGGGIENGPVKMPPAYWAPEASVLRGGCRPLRAAISYCFAARRPSDRQSLRTNIPDVPVSPQRFVEKMTAICGVWRSCWQTAEKEKPFQEKDPRCIDQDDVAEFSAGIYIHLGRGGQISRHKGTWPATPTRYSRRSSSHRASRLGVNRHRDLSPLGRSLCGVVVRCWVCPS
jgi:hypothetical protein